MNMENVSENLVSSTKLLQSAIENCEGAAEIVVVAKKKLFDARAAVKKEGKIDGKNEGDREIQYAEFCADEYEALAFAEKTERRTRDTIELCRLDYDLARYMLRIAELTQKAV